MDELYYNAIDLLKKMIATPSFSKEENGVADLIQSYIEETGILVFRNGNNVWCNSANMDLGKPTILLNSHIDTVKPVAGWKKDPFLPVIENDMLFGLGSNDAGASVVSLLHAFFYLTRKDQPYNLIFLASAEEEISGKNGIESIIPLLPPIAFAIVGEPTGMNAAIAEKGLMVLDCKTTGIAGHAARNDGENAIYKALKNIEWFRNYTFPKVSELLGKVNMNVTQINAGTQHNVIPDVCTFVVDVRTTDCYTNEEALNIIREHTDCEVTPRSTRLNSSGISADHPFVKRVQTLGKNTFGSPTLSDQTLMPFPSVKIGPGDSARSHTADEFVLLSEVREGIELYVRVLEGIILKK